MCCIASAGAFKAVPRRHALRIGAAALTAPAFAAAPAFAKSKRTMEIAEAEAKAKAEIAARTGLAEGAAGKGLRGKVDGFDELDTVQKNRKQNGGVARDANGRKVAISDRNPTPESLGLKQWNGNL